MEPRLYRRPGPRLGPACYRIPTQMATSVEEISAQIRAVLPDADVRVTDTTGGGDHFAAVVVSASFAGQSLVDRHRKVYGALGAALGGPIHAFALTTLTPDEQARKQP